MLVYGVGINDSEIPVKTTEGVCKYYIRWRGMLERCYSKRYQEKFPSYHGCSVSDKWLSFSEFRCWLIKQECNLGSIDGLDLDKDLLITGNKVYSEDTCCLVDKKINYFLLDRKRGRGELPIGVTKNDSSKKYQAQCKNPFTGKKEYLGVHEDKNDAHRAWCKRKLELAIQIRESDMIAPAKVKDNIVKICNANLVASMTDKPQ